MKTLRLACLLALALPLLAASNSQAQYNNSWGPHPAYKNKTPNKPAYRKTALRRASTTRSTKSRGSGCDTGCATGCDTAYKAGCDTGCDAKPACGCDATPVCGCSAAPACGCSAAPACGCDGKSGCDATPACGCDAAPGCGCAAGGQGGHKVCKLVKVEFEVEAICYGVHSHDMCVPGCGSKCTKTECIQCGGAGCDGCDGCDGCGSGVSCKLRYPTGKPGSCAKVKTVKHLVKYKTIKRVCGYRWEVVDAGCDACGCDAYGCDAYGCDADFESVPASDKSEGDPFGDDFPPIPIPQDPNA